MLNCVGLLVCYRCVSFRTRREGEEKAPNRGQFLIAATLGWLFEVGVLKNLTSVIKLFPVLFYSHSDTKHTNRHFL